MKRRMNFGHVSIITILLSMIVFAGSVRTIGWAAEGKYPSRAVQFVICYQPGSTDMAIRPFVDRLPDYLGQPVSFVYKPGASGAIGASFVTKAKPDGYTLIGTSQSPIMLCPLTKDVDYTLDNFIPICRLVKSPVLVAVKADSPWKTVKDLVEDAKKSPGKFTFSSTGVLGTPTLPMEIFVKMADIKMTHVPCPGTAPAVTALLGGHVDSTTATMASITPHIRSGALRPLGVFEKKRIKAFPEVPTFTEQGYPVSLSVWYGLLAPKGTSDEVVKTIYEACKKILDDHRKSVEDQLDKLSLELDFSAPGDFVKEIKEENDTMAKIVKDLMEKMPKK
jgi:tripartite-type tricarboxylate transporter receptor subunit TctC